jgi:hypothetical protein
MSLEECGVNTVSQLGGCPETRNKRGCICIPHVACAGFFDIKLVLLVARGQTGFRDAE